METLNKKEAIKNIMRLLDEGKTVYINGGSLWETIDYKANRKIIKWQNYGQSANKRNLKELTWLVNTIFECKNKKIVFTYK